MRFSWCFVAVVLLATLVLGAVGCGESAAPIASVTGQTSGPIPATTTTTEVVVLDFLSTFQAKDPFIQQMVSTTKTTGSGTTAQSGTTTSTKNGDTGGSGTTRTSSTHPTQTTSGTHYLKLLSVSTANGVAVCTFEVDRVVYQDKKVGDVASTSWGQVKVLAVNVENQTVVFQHGSESRTLSVGQQIVK